MTSEQLMFDDWYIFRLAPKIVINLLLDSSHLPASAVSTGRVGPPTGPDFREICALFDNLVNILVTLNAHGFVKRSRFR